jgi:hypothetical protein
MGLTPISNVDENGKVWTREELIAQENADRGKLPDRLSVVCEVYHQDMIDEPSNFRLTWERFLKSKEQPYIRKKGLVATPEWSSLDYGFLNGKPISLILIYNLEGIFTQVVPTVEEKSAAEGKILEIAYVDATRGFLIPPRESYPFYTDVPTDVVVRSRGGNCRYSLVAIPG